MILNDYIRYIQDPDIKICNIFILLFKEYKNVTLKKFIAYVFNLCPFSLFSHHVPIYINAMLNRMKVK